MEFPTREYFHLRDGWLLTQTSSTIRAENGILRPAAIQLRCFEKAEPSDERPIASTPPFAQYFENIEPNVSQTRKLSRIRCSGRFVNE